ncbi:unnamed protein product [Prunus armeniaca]
MVTLHMRLLPLLFILFNSVWSTTSNSATQSFLHCFTSNSHVQNFNSILESSIRNLRFLNPSTPKPEAIITPLHGSHVQAAIICSKKEGILIRIRRGAHDYEGLSYVSETPFIIIDLFKLRSIDIDIENESSWFESEGICHTVGVGGHGSGGGFDTLFRNYGLAADNVLDAKIVDVNGRVLDRKSMGEDLFWAIRGGGGSSFGVILAWKLRLVPVPPSVTVYRESKTTEQGATKFVSKWQVVADRIPEEHFLRLLVQVANGAGKNDGKTITVIFDFLFLETFEKLLPWMQDNFPDLCLDQTKFTEMSWIESVLYFESLPSNEVDVLLQRTEPSKRFFKAKSDYVTEPISEAGLEDLWQRMLQLEASDLILTPYGGRMSEISASETPSPHRKGNLFEIQYLVFWNDDKETKKNIGWLRRLYASMAPYVSKSPRAAYLQGLKYRPCS